MTAARRVFTAAEIAAFAPRSPVWPVVSLGALSFFSVLLPPGFTTAVNLYLAGLALLVVLAARRLPPLALMRFIWPFPAMIAIGILRGFEAQTYVFLRDGWYFSNPMMIMVVGYVLGSQIDGPARGLRAFVIGGTLVALLHLSWFLRYPDLLTLGTAEVRSYAGTGYFATVFVVLILIAHWGRWREELRLAPGVVGLCLGLNAASIALSYSRTLIVLLLFGALAAVGLFARRELWRVTLLLLVLLSAVLLVRSVIDPDSWEAKTTLIGKFGRVFEELQVTERMSLGEIQDNWRGYETARAVGQWADGGPVRWLFGEGLGAMVDVGKMQTMTRDPRDARRFFPIFHNGYVFVLVKTGLVGMALYLGFLAQLYLLGRRHANADAASPLRRLGRLMQACAVALGVSTAIFFGTFHQFDLLPVTMLCGFLLSQLAGSSHTKTGHTA